MWDVGGALASARLHQLSSGSRQFIKDALANGRLERVLHNQIDLHAEQVCQLIFQLDEPEQTRRPVKGDEDVDVAAGVLFLPDVGAEDAERAQAVSLRERRKVPA